MPSKAGGGDGHNKVNTVNSRYSSLLPTTPLHERMLPCDALHTTPSVPFLCPLYSYTHVWKESFMKRSRRGCQDKILLHNTTQLRVQEGGCDRRVPVPGQCHFLWNYSAVCHWLRPYPTPLPAHWLHFQTLPLACFLLPNWLIFLKQFIMWFPYSSRDPNRLSKPFCQACRSMWCVAAFYPCEPILPLEAAKPLRATGGLTLCSLTPTTPTKGQDRGSPTTKQQERKQ